MLWCWLAQGAALGESAPCALPVRSFFRYTSLLPRQVIPKTLSVNAAKDATELVAKLRAYHYTAQVGRAGAAGL